MEGGARELSGDANVLEKPSSSGHYSWNASTAARREELDRLGVSTAPQRVGASAAPTAGSLSPHASAWNAAGTWEERVVTATALAALKARLLSASFAPASPRLHVTSVNTLSGEVRLVSVRGKVRCGFELRLEVAWELASEGSGGGGGGGAAPTAASGTFAALVEDSEPDLFETLDVRVSNHAGLAKGEAVSLVKLADGQLRDLFRAWVKGTIQQQGKTPC
jgi:hypothetical protein